MRFFPSSRHPARTSRRSVQLLATVALSVGLFGCDTPEHQADKKIQDGLAAAEAQADGGDPAGVAKARTVYEQASAMTGLSAETRSTAKALLAQTEVESASIKIQQIDEDITAMNQLLDQIGNLARQVDRTHQDTKAFDKYDPKPAKDAIAASIAAIQGSADKPTWINDNGASIPSLAAVTQDISRLEGLIAQQHDQEKSLTDRRNQSLTDAEAAARSADASKSQQSVDEYTRASSLRKDAGNLTTQIEKVQADTKPMDAQLAMAKAQQTVLQEAIKLLQDQSAALDSGWKSLSEALMAQSSLAKQIVADGANPKPLPESADTNGMLSAVAGGSLNQKAEALGKLADQIKRERTDVETNLRDAMTHYTDASTAAQEVYQKYDRLANDPTSASKAELPAWKDLRDLYNPAKYKLDIATIQRQLGSMYLDEIASITARQQAQALVGKTLGASGLEVPAALNDPTLPDELKNASTSASDAYGKAEDAIRNLTSGTAPAPLPQVAKVELILTLYGEAQLAQVTGDKSAQEKLDAAKTARNEAVEANLPLPMLPPDLRITPSTARATGAPAT
ncbi:MAG: hypothetical protein JO353_03935 [Phycisphaerae bacterium]|nr:hypothetical protein [Phycisphaerae bacterium]